MLLNAPPPTMYSSRRSTSPSPSRYPTQHDRKSSIASSLSSLSPSMMSSTLSSDGSDANSILDEIGTSVSSGSSVSGFPSPGCIGRKLDAWVEDWNEDDDDDDDDDKGGERKVKAEAREQPANLESFVQELRRKDRVRFELAGESGDGLMDEDVPILISEEEYRNGRSTDRRRLNHRRSMPILSSSTYGRRSRQWEEDTTNHPVLVESIPYDDDEEDDLASPSLRPAGDSSTSKPESRTTSRRLRYHPSMDFGIQRNVTDSSFFRAPQHPLLKKRPSRLGFVPTATAAGGATASDGAKGSPAFLNDGGEETSTVASLTRLTKFLVSKSISSIYPSSSNPSTPSNTSSSSSTTTSVRDGLRRRFLANNKSPIQNFINLQIWLIYLGLYVTGMWIAVWLKVLDAGFGVVKVLKRRRN